MDRCTYSDILLKRSMEACECSEGEENRRSRLVETRTSQEWMDGWMDGGKFIRLYCYIGAGLSFILKWLYTVGFYC